MEKDLYEVLVSSIDINNYKVIEKRNDYIKLEGPNNEECIAYTTSSLSNVTTSSVIGYVIEIKPLPDRKYIVTKALSGTNVEEKIVFNEGEKELSYSKKELLLPYELGEEYASEIGAVPGNNIIPMNYYYMIIANNRESFNTVLKIDEYPIYTKRKNEYGDLFVTRRFCNDEGKYFYNDNVNKGEMLVDDNLFYRMFYLANGKDANYVAYFCEDVCNHMELVGTFTPAPLASFDDPYSYLFKNKDIKRDEIYSYLTVSRYGKDCFDRVLIYKLDGKIIIDYNYEVSEMNYNTVEYVLPVSSEGKITSLEVSTILDKCKEFISNPLFLEVVVRELGEIISRLDEASKKIKVEEELSFEEIKEDFLTITNPINEVLNNNRNVEEELVNNNSKSKIYQLQKKVD